MIKVKVDVLKIDKSKLYVGEKGTYLDLILIETPDNKYGNDYLCKQDGEKDDDMPIIGNAKILKPKEQDQSETPPDDDLPF